MARVAGAGLAAAGLADAEVFGLNKSPSVFFAAPSFVSSGTDSIVFFIKSTDTISGPNGSPWDEEIDGTKGTPGNYPFQIWGSIFNADNNGSHGTVVILKAVSASNGTNRYAVTGEVVSPQVDLDGGNMVTGPYTPNTPGVPPAWDKAWMTRPCTPGYMAGTSTSYRPCGSRAC